MTQSLFLQSVAEYTLGVGHVAQPVERFVHTEEVPRSSRGMSTGYVNKTVVDLS